MENLIKKRSSVKGRITMFKNYLDLITNVSTDKLKEHLCELQLRLGKLDIIFSAFDEIQTEIEVLSSNSAEQLKEREDIENLFFTYMSRAQSILVKVKQLDDKSSLEIHTKQSSSGEKDGSSASIKLPTIKLPTFDGNFSTWLEFRDTFDSLVNSNASIDCINKYHHLRASLEGSAAEVIKSLEVSASNYKLAWDLLCERYDNKRLLINNHLKALFSIEAMCKESDLALRSLIDHLSKNLRALKALGEPVDYWDTIVIHFASMKLDNSTNRQWEEYKGELKNVPNLATFYKFLRNKADVLETVRQSKIAPKVEKFSHFVTSVDAPSGRQLPGCVFCKQAHRLHQCPQFRSLDIDKRHEVVSRHKLCINCFRSGHYAPNCRSVPCNICKYKHNTLLHRPKRTNNFVNNNNSMQVVKPREESAVGSASASSPPPPPPVGPVSLSTIASQHVLLSTALVCIENKETQKYEFVRILLDCGSQITVVTDRLCQRLGLNRKKNKQPLTVSGVCNMKIDIVDSCEFVMTSRDGVFSCSVRGMVVPEITNALPSAEIDINSLNIPNGLNLADPQFYHPGEIDLLVGADLFWEILNDRKIRLGNGKPVLQDSRVGWIVSGPVDIKTKGSISSNVLCNKMAVDNISQQVERFWSTEELSGDDCLSSSSKLSGNDKFCEEHFVSNTYRTDNGRFCVKMPLHTSPSALGDSYQMAKMRLYNLERRFRKQPYIKQPYVEFINEYEQLGHLTEVNKPVFGCYLPHHAVLREKSETTRCRVVFDASAKTSSGKSLNDLQAVGPVVQDDLLNILLRFRQHNFVLTADIEKMYRQILIDDSQRNLQLILWRSDEDKPIKVLRLNTVTYGTASAPFLSTRCIYQLAEECKDEMIKRTMKRDFYMDDLITGCDSVESLVELANSVSQKLSTAGFNLRKFRTNSELDPDKHVLNENQDISDVSNTTSTLGLVWSPVRDELVFTMKFDDLKKPTKRSILSAIAKIFDPLGLLSIFIVRAKMLLQRLWSCNLKWDDEIPNEVKLIWINFVNSVNNINNITVPRHVTCKYAVGLELHLFSDSSLSAFGVCAYLRSVDDKGQVRVKLLCAKSRVAPLKKLTIPRLELCGCYLAAQLGTKICNAMTCKFDFVFYWTDSTIALSWIHAFADKKVEVFVSNRVTKINKLTKNCEWRHVPTKENPADLISRGVASFSDEISSFWFNGPNFLKKGKELWPCLVTKGNEVKDEEYIVLPQVDVAASNVIIEIHKYSSLKFIERVMAYVLRFVYNCKNKSKKVIGDLGVDELSKSRLHLAKISQKETYFEELNVLKAKKQLSSNCGLLSLSPFLDEFGLLRVGGRLENSTFSFDKKHPILLSSKHRLTRLIFEEEHRKLMHAGPQLLLYSVRERYWVVNGRNIARSVVSKCVLCKRYRGKTVVPMMGNLPKQRLTPSLPFECSGVDFAGPFYITDRKGRGCRITKCYLCLFVCFATKALHLEAVSELSKEAFILTLRRFIARRGKPSIIFCDNGSNFVGASNELNNFIKNNQEYVARFGTEEHIKFKFSPAYSPNFGGLFEAGVKSAKHHVRRILGDKHLTYEELATLFVQVEAILNSRPLCPLSSNPTDLVPLTPGHFLIGRPLTSIPSQDVTEIKENRLNRYEHLEQMRQHFWRRWHHEYISELQNKVKWQKQKYPELQVGDMVVLKEDGCPPLKWRIGRVHTIYPGSDGIARVADVLTSTGIIRRAFNRLCPLVQQLEDNNDVLNPELQGREDVKANE